MDPEKHRNKISKRTNCPCRIVLRSPKMISPYWHITTAVTAHSGHGFEQGTMEFNRRDRQLTDKMLEQISSLAGRFNAKQIIYLLNQEWPDKVFDLRTVTNAIQKARNNVYSDGSEAAELYKLLQDKARKDKEWYFATELDAEGRLQRIFWMSPSQRSLYRRYRDVVLSDNTFKTNRFGMPFNAIVIVDNSGKNRLVGCSLVSGEHTKDYEWILRQLLMANDNLAPHTIIVDNDHAMEAACASVIGRTVLLNCIWHLGHQNLGRNLRGALGKDWQAFISTFWTTRNALTVVDFENRWSQHVKVFGVDKPDVEAYLEWIFKRREHWAWPWVGTRFTAGIQATQRVESVNAIIKRAVNSKTSLPVLFESTEKMLSDEARTSRYLHYRMDMTADPSLTQFTKKMFADIIDVNSRFLGIAAKGQMMMEMMRSIYYQSELHQATKVERAAECNEDQPNEAGDDDKVSI